MIKKIYHLADVHIPTYQKLDMYGAELDRVIKSIGEDINKSNLEYEEARILIAGDLVHSKNMITNELSVFVSTFIRNLEQLAPVVVIAGNHDLVESNLSRTDTLTGIFETAHFEHSTFLDKQCDYCSGVVYDDNVTWALYSFFDEFNMPDIEDARKEYPENTVIGLFHGAIIGTKLYNGFIVDFGHESNIFEGCDMVMAGHIHKRQELKYKDCSIVYPGSTIQLNYGESLTQHGYCVWDLENNSHEFIDIPTEYGYYKITINSLNDLKEDKEILANY